ncbi:MAG: helix-turn-helix domain-containing protein [Candidatus Nanopelagicales bacterium]
MEDALGVALQAVGEKWAFLVVREVGLGVRRFDELQAVTGAPRAVLTDRLGRLVGTGILETRAYRQPGQRARQEYALTDAGIDLLPVLAALSDWGSLHLPAGAVREVDYRHLGCGGRVTARLVCECGEPVGSHDRLIAQINR